MRIIISGIVVLFSLCGVSMTKAQLNPDPKINEILLEKLKVPMDAHGHPVLPGQRAADATNTGGAMKSGNYTDGPVSSDPLAESEIHAMINPTDSSNMVVSAMRIDNLDASNLLSCPIYFTKDFGRTWKKSAFQNVPPVNNPLVLGGGDPVFACDANGTLYFSWISIFGQNGQPDSLNWAMLWSRSTDGGETWTLSQNPYIAYSEKYLSVLLEMFDKQWLAVDRSNSAFRGTVYSAMLQVHKGSEMYGSFMIVLRKKAPDSEEFKQVSVVSSPKFKFVQYSSIDVDNNGGVHVTFFGSTDTLNYALYHALSTDGGETFQPDTKISDVHIMRFSGDEKNGILQGFDRSRVYPCPHLRIDPKTQALYMVWSANGTDERLYNGMDIYFSRSENNGAKWSKPVIVNDDPPETGCDQFHPSIAVNRNGVLAITWYDRRTDTANRVTNYYITTSTDGGRTFSKNEPVSSVPTDMATIGVKNDKFGYGEYTQVLASDFYAIPFWSDGRTNDGNLNIYTTMLPLGAPTSIGRVSAVTDAFRLLESWPEPCVDNVTIRFELRSPMTVRLTVSDIAGRVVDGGSHKRYEPGVHAQVVNTAALRAGAYFYRLDTDRGYATGRFTIVK